MSKQTEKTLHHVGLILDGNRRWAKANGKKALEGHRRGAEVFKELSLHLFEQGVEYVSAYIFSTENWQRTTEEVDYLMKLVARAVELHLDEYHKKGIRVVVLGAREGLKDHVRKSIERTEKKTAENTRGTLALCFNYGGRQEIVDAVQALKDSEGEITEQSITEHLYCPEVPDVDLIIRTSGEQRLSGFMLWRASYAELAFVDTLWPDMTTEEIDTVLHNYQERERRFGC